MTAIVGVHFRDEIAIGAETLYTTSDSEVHSGPNQRHTSKILEYDGVYIGSRGWAIYDMILPAFLEHRTPGAAAFEDRQLLFKVFLQLFEDVSNKYAQDTDAEDDLAGLHAEFMIASVAGLFTVDAELYVTEWTQYAAIGAGGPYAFGALYALYGNAELAAADMCKGALDAAIHFSPTCGGAKEIYTVQVEDKHDQRSHEKGCRSHSQGPGGHSSLR